MPLPPVKPPEKLLLEIYKDLLQGATRKFGDAFSVIADRLLEGRVRSAEELALDLMTGDAISASRRQLAAEAIDRILPENRVFPAPQIAGPIFRESEFELPNTPIWDLWSQLLSRACDQSRVNEAHPAFPGIIKQLSPEEANLLHLITKTKSNQPLTIFSRFGTADPIGRVMFPSPEWEGRFRFFPHFVEGISHLEQLGLIASLNYNVKEANAGENEKFITQKSTYTLTDWGRLFMRAVSKTPSHNE